MHGWFGPGWRGAYRHGYHHGYNRGWQEGFRHGARAGYAAGQQATRRNIYNQASNRARNAPRTRDARPSTRQVEDGSYTALKSITLGYNLPASVAERIFGSPQSVRLFGSINNVFVWTDYWGWNPEVSVQSDGLTPGQDYGAYPLMRAYQLGLEIRF